MVEIVGMVEETVRALEGADLLFLVTWEGERWVMIRRDERDKVVTSRVEPRRMGNCSWQTRLCSSILEELRRQREGRVILRWDATSVLIDEILGWLWWSGDIWW